MKHSHMQAIMPPKFKLPVHFSTKFKAFVFKGSPLPGLHPTLKSVFYKNYSYNKATQGPTTPAAKGKITRLKPGKKAGILVDNELKKTVQLLVKYNLPTSVFTSHDHQIKHAVKISDQLTDRDKAMLKKKLSNGTTRLWQTLIKYNLTPEAAQVAVGSKELRMATACDLVCRDSLNRKVIVEIKTGFATYYHLHTGHFLTGVTPAQTDSPFNQHQLQLMMSIELYRRTFPLSVVAQGIIMKVDCLGVDVIPLQSFVKNNLSTICNLIQNRKK